MVDRADPVFEVIQPGLLTTVQDLGRPDAATFGAARSGACDPLALSAANLLAGNPVGSAALEVSLLGPELRVLRACLVAPAGADFETTIAETGERLRPGRSAALSAGTTLRMGAAVDGARGYLAVRGGFDVPAVLGSRSTALGAGFGGFAGRALLPGDALAVTASAPPLAKAQALRSWPGPGASSGVPGASADPVVLRVVRGPHADLLGPEAWNMATETTWEVDPWSDRMGVRLAASDGGSRLEPAAGGPSLVSLPVTWGAVQLPPGGSPICLLTDHPTVGGYPVVAVVITADLPILGQLAPSDRVRLLPIDLADAQAAMLRAESDLVEAARRLAEARPSSAGGITRG